MEFPNYDVYSGTISYSTNLGISWTSMHFRVTYLLLARDVTIHRTIDISQ